MNKSLNFNMVKKVYLSWLDKTKLKNIICKNILYEGFSIWWSNNLTDKDTYFNNKWFYNLKNRLNNKKEAYQNSLDLKFLKLTKHFIKNFFFILILKLFFKDKNSTKKRESCFMIEYSDMNKYGQFFLDKRFSYSPLDNKNKNSFIITLKMNFETIKNYKTIKKNLNLNKIDYFFLHNFISFYELTNIYLKNIILFYKAKKIFKKKNYFIIRKKDVSNILENLFLNSFFGNVQDSLIVAKSLSNFFLKNSHKNFFTYYEFYPRSRAIYYFIKKYHPNTNIISIQHTPFTKNNTFYHLNKNDFNIKKKFNSPKPDYYLTQGILYTNYLKGILNSNSIFTIGSLKNDFIIKNKKLKKLKKLKKFLKKKGKFKKIILIITSVKDEKNILYFLNKLNLKQYLIILSPFYASKNQTLNKFKKMAKFNYHLFPQFSSDLLMQEADLIIGDFTSLLQEAFLFHKLNVVRIVDSVAPSTADKSDSIPIIKNVGEFMNYLYKKNKTTNVLIKQTIKNTVYKYDKKAFKRLNEFKKKYLI